MTIIFTKFIIIFLVLVKKVNPSKYHNVQKILFLPRWTIYVIRIFAKIMDKMYGEGLWQKQLVVIFQMRLWMVKNQQQMMMMN